MLLGAALMVLGVQTALTAVVSSMFRVRRDADIA